MVVCINKFHTQLLTQIEHKRTELKIVAKQTGISSVETILVSKELDELLNHLQKSNNLAINREKGYFQD